MQEFQQHDAVDVFIGVDVGKGQHHAVALGRNGKRLYNKALPNDETKLRALIAELQGPWPPSLRCRPTRHYWRIAGGRRSR